MKWLEPETDHECTGNGYGRAEACGTFDESAEAERYEQELQAPVGRDCGHGLLHDFELAGLDGNIVEKDCGDHDHTIFSRPNAAP